MNTNNLLTVSNLIFFFQHFKLHFPFQFKISGRYGFLDKTENLVIDNQKTSTPLPTKWLQRKLRIPWLSLFQLQKPVTKNGSISPEPTPNSILFYTTQEHKDIVYSQKARRERRKRIRRKIIPRVTEFNFHSSKS